MAWYVYGITLTTGRPTVTVTGAVGLHGADVVLQGNGDVCVVASAVPPDAPDLRDADVQEALEAVRCHDEVLLALSRTHPVLPVRFGTVLADREAIADLLTSRGDQFREALEAVTGTDEWVIRVDAESIDDAPDDEEGLSPGHAFFAKRKAMARARADAREAATARAGELHGRLSALARRVHPLPVREPATLTRTAYLVDREVADSFVAAAESASGVRIGVQGPLPPFRFVSDAP